MFLSVAMRVRFGALGCADLIQVALPVVRSGDTISSTLVKTNRTVS